MNLRRLIPFSRISTAQWAVEARILHWLTFLRLGLGLIILFSASYPEGVFTLNDGLYYIKRQLIAVIIGLFVFQSIVHLPLRRILGVSHWFVLGLLILLLLTALSGEKANGAQRWLSVNSDKTIQPSELIKPFLVLQGALVFGKWHKQRWSARLIWLIIFGLVIAAIVEQPNLSTAGICGIMLWLVALAAGLPYIYLIAPAVLGLIAAVISISVNPYQLERIQSFLNPWSDPMGDGFQVIQSLTAVGSGGITGTGFGLSQQKLFYVPYPHTDFIFGVFAEEFGIIGSLLLLLLVLTYATVALIVALKNKNPIHRLVAVGAMVLLVGQSIFHIGVNIGAFPPTGITLPFVSYGSNAIISSLIVSALLIRVAREGKDAKIVQLGTPRQIAKGNTRSQI